MLQVLKRAFNLHGDTASYEEISDRILGGGVVRGTNLCILLLAILIASIGLNMNSTAVVIGAMLISPLMGGIIGITRKEKSNVIPGVAIATALMPPLCTAGYGIANGNYRFVLGALYLFVINCFFICLTSLIVLLILNVPKQSAIKLKPDVIKRVKRSIVRNSLILIIPSIIFGYQMVRQEMRTSTAASEQVIFNVTKTIKELQLFFPEIQNIQIGYMDQYNAETDAAEEKLLAIVYVEAMPKSYEKEKIEHWLKLEYNLDEVIYHMENTQTDEQNVPLITPKNDSQNAPQEDAQDKTQNEAQNKVQEDAQNNTQDNAQDDTQNDTQ